MNSALDAQLAAVIRQSEEPYLAFLQDAEAEVRTAYPELEAVPEISAQFGRMVGAHARAIETMLSAPSMQDLDQIASGATRFARDCAHWDVPVTTLIGILQRGVELSWAWWISRIEETVPDPELCAAMSVRCGRLLMEYMSRAVELIVVVHNTEREARLWGASWRQRQAVTEVLAGREPVHLDELSLEVGHAFDGWQVGFVAWAGADADEVRLGTEMKAWISDVANTTPLLIPGDGGAVWGWASSAEWPAWTTARLPAPPVGARLGLGQPGRGLAGFRDSHAEALQLRTLAMRTRSDLPILRHTELAPVTLLTHDIAQLRRFVARALGGLSEDSPRVEGLRATVRCYLDEGENVREVAAKMHYHRNTIRGRLELAARLRGRGLDEDRLTLALALEIAEAYGGLVLSEPIAGGAGPG